MSNAKTLVLAFSQSQIEGPVRERINAVHSVQLYLNRAGVKPSEGLSSFLTPVFYCLADTKRAISRDGEVQISSCAKGLREFGYITSGEVARVALTKRQREFVQDLGFETRDESTGRPPVERIQLRKRAFNGLNYAVNEGYRSGCQLG